jgi:hypothetical protein
MSLRIRRSLRHLRRAIEVLVERPTRDGVSTADLHTREPSHPSLLCRCPGWEYFHSHGAPIDHEPSCRWLRYRCTGCIGDGWCGRCGGDGVDPEARA